MTDRRWTALIDEVIAGDWISPLTGRRQPPLAFGAIEICESLAGREADLVAQAGMTPPFLIVSDPNTHPAMGARVAKALAQRGPVREWIVDDPHCDMASIAALQGQIDAAEAVVVVGSGTLNDLCKFATFRRGKPYCVFATAPSMNGYASSTASVTLETGLKISLPAQMPRGVFIDLEVSAAAPLRLRAAGFGDCICRSVAQVDWWMSHRLFGTPYFHEPYVLEIPDEIILMERAEGVARGEIEAIGALHRVLMLAGVGVCITGVSNHGSMGEHQISHYLDCFTGAAHPGTLHGHQVGVASLTMARIQGHYLARDTPPEIGPTRLDPEGMAARMGPQIAQACLAEIRKKALDAEGAAAAQARLTEIWPALRQECLDRFVPPEQLAERLRAAGGATTATELGFAVETYREAVRHAHEMRNRYAFTDLADAAGDLDGLAAQET